MLSESDIYDYLLAAKTTIKEVRNDPTESKRALIRFKNWFAKKEEQLRLQIEEENEGKLLKIRDVRYLTISELNNVFKGLKTLSISTLDAETLEEMMDDLSVFFDRIDIRSFKEPEYEMTTNLSPSLLNLFDVNAPSTSNSTPINWQPPKFSGLSNSEPIVKKVVKQADKKNSYIDNNNEIKSKNEGKGISSAPISISKVSADRFSADSKQANRFDDDNFSDKDSSVDGDENYDLDIDESSMSASLKAALGIDSKEVIQTDWKPPSRPGMDNSDPIISNNNNNQYRRSDEKGQTSERNENKNDLFSETSSVYSDDRSEVSEDDDAIYTRLTSGSMSSNLMQNLGIDDNNNNNIETDWKPPSFSGVTNSDPIVKMGKK